MTIFSLLYYIGTKYWVYYGQFPVSGYPRPVKELGLPNAIDAAVPIGSRKTFFFKKSLVWRYDEKKKEMDKGFPKPIKQVFQGLPRRIRIAFAHNDGRIDGILSWAGRSIQTNSMKSLHTVSYPYSGNNLSQYMFNELPPSGSFRFNTVQLDLWPFRNNLNMPV